MPTSDQSPPRSAQEPSTDAAALPYVVLARKYRPQTFDDLIGQDVMVRTLRHAFASGRIAQAYMLTGVRGVGKTTTARILARALNYAPEDGLDGSPTLDMAQEGLHCRRIMESHHQDVVEMDAASHTGIDDIREIIEAVRYRPVEARYKVYIIDEVHMLSKAAFNGLLKTLEEPPDHVKFIFATTEVRKVPVTVLSRCQRFDLRRVEEEVLKTHLAAVAKAENAEVEDAALSLIARAAEGSVRDGLSILDQAISQTGAATTSTEVRQMLGLADRGRVLDLLERVLESDAGTALSTLEGLHRDGADPIQLLADLAELVHQVTRAKITADGGNGLSQADAPAAERIGALAAKLSIPQLTRLWQMLLKAHGEAAGAPRPLDAAEMALIRVAYAAGLPTPDRILADMAAAPASLAADGPAADGPDLLADTNLAPRPDAGPGSRGSALRAPEMEPFATAQQAEPDTQTQPVARPELNTLQDVIELAETHRDIQIKTALLEDVRLVRLEPGRLEISLEPAARRNLANTLARRLEAWDRRTLGGGGLQRARRAAARSARARAGGRSEGSRARIAGSAQSSGALPRCGNSRCARA